MDTAQWHQDILARPVEESLVATNKSSSVERNVRPHQKEQAVNCPRCNSTNTKFCYYNNYSLTQPRFFCKTCRRYWTKGGSLRNIPVGGGSRKNKRPSTSSISNPSKKLPDLAPQQQNPKTNDTSQDLNLGIYSSDPNQQFQIDPSSTRGLSSFIQMNNDPNNPSASSTGFPLPEFRPSLNFSLDGLGSNYGSFRGVQESSGKHLLFPFEDLKQVPPSNDEHNNGEQNGEADSNGYWNGVIGGGSW